MRSHLPAYLAVSVSPKLLSRTCRSHRPQCDHCLTPHGGNRCLPSRFKY
jgi:hypothetical protein